MFKWVEKLGDAMNSLARANDPCTPVLFHLQFMTAMRAQQEQAEIEARNQREEKEMMAMHAMGLGSLLWQASQLQKGQEAAASNEPMQLTQLDPAVGKIQGAGIWNFVEPTEGARK